MPIDTLETLSTDRKVKVKIDHKSSLDWDALRVKVKKGMRNATLMAIAPTANIGHIAGTTPGIDPQFAQIFSRSTLNGKFLEVNNNRRDPRDDGGRQSSGRIRYHGQYSVLAEPQ